MLLYPRLQLHSDRTDSLPAAGYRSRAVIGLLLVAAIMGFGIPFVTRMRSEWDTVFVRTAEHLLAGRDIYAQPDGYTYPPFQAFLAVPFAMMPTTANRIAFYGLNLVCLYWLFRSATKLAGGFTIVGAAAGAMFAFHCYAHQQTDIISAALVLGGCSYFARGKSLAAATLFGLGAAMKCTPLLFAPYLLVKGKPVAATWLILIAIGANLLPDAIHRPAEGTWVSKWYEMYLAPMTRPEYSPGVWASDIIYNQSLVGAMKRWTSTTWSVVEHKVEMRAIPASMPPGEMKRLLVGCFAGLGALALAAIILGRRSERSIAWECGMVVSAMLLMSPMSSVPHFATLLLPGLLFAQMYRERRTTYILIFGTILLLGALATNKDLIGSKNYTIGLWYGSAMWCAIASFFGCAVGLITSAKPSHVQQLPIQVPVRKAA